LKYNLPNDFISKVENSFSLTKSTWFQTGGKTDIYCHIFDEKDLKFILNQTPEEIPIFILGAGSNVLVRDGGFKGIIIRLGKGFNKIDLKNKKLIVGAGVLDSTLSKFALRNSIMNLEFYSGIPGTVGGAVKMNAGCYGSETKDVIESVITINRLGEENFHNISDLNFKYRSSSINNDLIVKEVVFKAIIGRPKEIELRMKNIINQRESSQPLRNKTGGSTFKNPKGFFAAKLIEEAGCKGMQVGDAIVSSKHANFLINQNNASATDIEILGEKIKEQVFNKFNILLDWEIIIIGDKT